MSEIIMAVIGMPFQMAMGSELSRRQFHGIAQALLIERDQLLAENAGLRTGYEAYERVNAGLKAENESLRSDIQSWRLSIEAERNVHKLSMKGIQDELDRLTGPSFTVELAALRKDAERYLGIKLDASMGGSLIERLDCNVPVKLWDYAIDRELAK